MASYVLNKGGDVAVVVFGLRGFDSRFDPEAWRDVRRDLRSTVRLRVRRASVGGSIRVVREPDPPPPIRTLRRHGVVAAASAAYRVRDAVVPVVSAHRPLWWAATEDGFACACAKVWQAVLLAGRHPCPAAILAPQCVIPAPIPAPR